MFKVSGLGFEIDFRSRFANDPSYLEFGLSVGFGSLVAQRFFDVI
jgi:hypothetical protein